MLSGNGERKKTLVIVTAVMLTAYAAPNDGHTMRKTRSTTSLYQAPSATRLLRARFVTLIFFPSYFHSRRSAACTHASGRQESKAWGGRLHVQTTTTQAAANIPPFISVNFSGRGIVCFTPVCKSHVPFHRTSQHLQHHHHSSSPRLWLFFFSHFPADRPAAAPRHASGPRNRSHGERTCARRRNSAGEHLPA